MGYVLNESMAEIIGVIIGDGCIYCKNNHYSIEIVGNPYCEKKYYNYLSHLVNICFDKNPSIGVRARGLRLKFYSKDAVLYLINNINLEHGKGKHARVKIPEKILKNKKLLIACLRGIVDTDGSLFFAKKGNNLSYPCIEITTTSLILSKQIKIVLLSLGFRVSYRIELREKYFDAYRIAVYGEKMVNKWFNEIGFSNFHKLDLYNSHIRNF